MLNEITPYFEISQLNSLRFTKQVSFDSYSNQKTPKNTLSYQEKGVNSRTFFHLFQFIDAIRVQFKSSYESHEIKLFGCDESETTILPVKRTSYLDFIDHRSAGAVDYNGFLTVYFGQGNLLDPNSFSIIGTYDLGQYTPDFLPVGKTILIETTTTFETEITNLVWLENEQVYGLQTNTPYSTIPQGIIIKTQYNKFEYEIYEFDIDFYHFSKGKYQVEIKAVDPNFEDQTYLSERIDLRAYHEDTHLIICENESSNQINYSWGIQHLLRLPYERELTYSPSGENEVHKTDSNTFLIDSDTYENYEVTFKPLPTGMAIRLTMLFSLTTIFIDSRSYVAENKPEAERLEDSNLYSIKAKVVLSNQVYKSNSSDFTTEAVYNQGLLQVDDGYLMSGAVGLLAID